MLDISEIDLNKISNDDLLDIYTIAKEFVDFLKDENKAEGEK